MLLYDWPRAILHIDGDCFFASCEVAQNPKYRGQPLITGLERGIVSSLTYEAKALGIKRGMRLGDVKKVCPTIIMLPSDYETYSLYSVRMYNIVRRFTSLVEEYSIDECFAELTGLQRPLNMSYEKIAATIKTTLDKELGITFSVGLAPTKVLAKVASKWRKPSGLTIIPGRDIPEYLKIDPEKIWGIGSQTAAYCKNLGINTALDFAKKDETWIKNKFTKPHQEIWQELNGQSAYEISTESKEHYQSISKTKTFTPGSDDSEYIFGQLAKNVENANIKARRHRLACQKIFFFIKTQDFRYHGAELTLSRPTNLPLEILPPLRTAFDQIFKKKLYRATGIVLLDLHPENSQQLDLFCQVIKLEKLNKLFLSFDELSERYGKHIVFMGASWPAMTVTSQPNIRQVRSQRQANISKGENQRQHIGLPYMGAVE